jgi:hypothetical protein
LLSDKDGLNEKQLRMLDVRNCFCIENNLFNLNQI